MTIKIGAPNNDVIIPTGNSIVPDLAIKSAALSVNEPNNAENGRTTL